MLWGLSDDVEVEFGLGSPDQGGGFGEVYMRIWERETGLIFCFCSKYSARLRGSICLVLNIASQVIHHRQQEH